MTFLDNYVITIMARLEYGRLVTNKNELQLHTIRKVLKKKLLSRKA